MSAEAAPSASLLPANEWFYYSPVPPEQAGFSVHRLPFILATTRRQGTVSKSFHTVAVLTVDIRDPHYARTAYTIERGLGVPVVEEIRESVLKNRPFLKELSIDKSVSGL